MVARMVGVECFRARSCADLCMVVLSFADNKNGAFEARQTWMGSR